MTPEKRKRCLWFGQMNSYLVVLCTKICGLSAACFSVSRKNTSLFVLQKNKVEKVAERGAEINITSPQFVSFGFKNRQRELLTQQTYVLRGGHLVQACVCVCLSGGSGGLRSVRCSRQRQTPRLVGCQHLVTNDAAALSSANWPDRDGSGPRSLLRLLAIMCVCVHRGGVF